MEGKPGDVNALIEGGEKSLRVSVRRRQSTLCCKKRFVRGFACVGLVEENLSYCTRPTRFPTVCRVAVRGKA